MDLFHIADPLEGMMSDLIGSPSNPNPQVSSENPSLPDSSSVNKSDDALSQLHNLAQSNPEYMELYLKLLAERENTASAQAWYEKMSGSQYQRAAKDLQSAGLNPYLALQSLGGAGSGSVSPAGTWSTSPYSNAEAKRSNQANESLKGAQIAMTLVTAVIAAIALIA